MASRTSARSSWSEISMNVDLIDDADNRGIDGRGLTPERFTRGAPFEDDEHLLVNPGADAVDRQQRRASRRVVDADRLYEQELGAVELRVFLRRHDRSDHAGDLHERATPDPNDR